MPAFTTRHSKMKMFWVVLGSLVFLGFGVLAIMKPEVFEDSRRAWMLPFIAWAALLMGGLGSVFGAYQMFNSKAQIKVDENGVFAAKLSNETIPWSMIEDLEIKEVAIVASRQVYVVMQMAAESENLIQFKRAYAMNKGANKTFGIHGPHFVLNGMVEKPRDIALEISKLYKHYRG